MSDVIKARKLRRGWITLEWGVNVDFFIEILEGPSDLQLRRRTAGVPYGKTKERRIHISNGQTLPIGSIQAKGCKGRIVRYRYIPGSYADG